MLNPLSNTDKTPQPNKLNRALKMFEDLGKTGEIGSKTFDLKLKKGTMDMMKDANVKSKGVTIPEMKQKYMSDRDNPTWE